MPEAADDRQRARLAWRCRRGMKELDLLLLAWLETAWPTASAAERMTFDQILDLPDPELAGYLLGHAQSSESRIASLVAALQALAASPRSGAGAAAPRNPG
jgi:antitoxin CptB